MKLSLLKFCKLAAGREATERVKPSVYRKNFFRIYGATMLTQLLCVIYVEEFALPTPDMIYDLHLKYSQGFIDFAQGNKYGAGALRRVSQRQKSVNDQNR